jgi:hypothetical protein
VKALEIFLAWQSDFGPSRTTIQAVLESVTSELAATEQLVAPLLLTGAVAQGDGAVRIDAKVVEAISRASVFVADLTVVGRILERLLPNPNVLVEVGYALASLGPNRVILLEAERDQADLPGDGQFAHQFPFDLTTLHRLRFSESADLQRRLHTELRAILVRQGWILSS